MGRVSYPDGWQQNAAEVVMAILNRLASEGAAMPANLALAVMMSPPRDPSYSSTALDRLQATGWIRIDDPRGNRKVHILKGVHKGAVLQGHRANAARDKGPKLGNYILEYRKGEKSVSGYQPDIIIYHSPCSDGFAAAWACWKKWGDAPDYYPTNYGSPPPDVTGKHVLIVDFSYKQDVIVQMMRSAETIVILDHHKSAQEDLEPFSVGTLNRGHLHHSDIGGILRDWFLDNRPLVLASFDMERSGARIAWDFCHETEAPKLIKLVEDRDLWRFKYEETKPFALMLKTIAERFDTWDCLNQTMSADRMMEAHGMVRYQDYLVEAIAAKAHWVERGSLKFLAVNCPSVLSSEVCNRILADNADTPFAASWNDGETYRGWSLRSTDDRMDVADIASGFGGGGHRNAAGFSEPLR